ncbi:uncharacterized protein [Garra rufa]|uniref:uncharacterized protein n=1 Tax=Garra rufa TaxID=137080 RepID=UPI003CCEE770
MELISTRLSICFLITTYAFLEHAVTSDLQSYYIECMQGDSSPSCCQVPCQWEPEDTTQKTDANCKVYDDYMECFYGANKKNSTIPLIPTGKVKKGASCNIRKHGQSDYNVSCYENKKPICCDSQCKCDLNLLTCQIKEGKIECRWSVGANPVFDKCFKNTSKRLCDLGKGDKCYIYTGSSPVDGDAERQEKNTSSCNSTVGKWICTFNCQHLDSDIATISLICCFIAIAIGIGIGIGFCIGKSKYTEKKTEGNGQNKTTTKNKNKKYYRRNGSESEKNKMVKSQK